MSYRLSLSHSAGRVGLGHRCPVTRRGVPCRTTPSNVLKASIRMGLAEVIQRKMGFGTPAGEVPKGCWGTTVVEGTRVRASDAVLPEVLPGSDFGREAWH